MKRAAGRQIAATLHDVDSSRRQEASPLSLITHHAFSAGTSSHRLCFQLFKPSSASCTPLAPSSRFQRNAPSPATCCRKSSHCALNALSHAAIVRHLLPAREEIDRLRDVGIPHGLGRVCRSAAIKQRRSPATAEPCVPSTCKVSRSSRRTRTHHELLKCAIDAAGELEGRVRGVVRRAGTVLPFSSQRCGMCVAPRQRDRLHRAEQIVEHVAPVAQHVEDDAAAVLLAVVPGRALRRAGQVLALEHPVAELAAHRQDAAEEARVAQHLELEQARQPELVLHDAVLDARLLRGAVHVERVRERRRHRLFAVDVLAGRDRLLEELRPQLRGGGVEEDLVAPVRQRLVEVRRPALDAVRVAPAAAACRRCVPTRIGSGMSRVPSASATPPCLRISRIERTRCWFVPMRPVTPCMMMPTRRSLTRPSFPAVPISA